MSTSLTESDSLAMTLTILLSELNTFVSTVLRNGRKESALIFLQFCFIGYMSIRESDTQPYVRESPDPEAIAEAAFAALIMSESSVFSEYA